MRSASSTPGRVATRGCGPIVTLVPLLIFFFTFSVSAQVALGQSDQAKRSLTPLQLEIEKQRQRLTSLEVEERRDALMRLAALRHPDSSRAAVPALNDSWAIVRATAAGAILWLSAEESAGLLTPLLDDKDEFVRQEVAYAVGRTGSRSGVGPLAERLLRDKKPGVRGAAAVALGQIGSEAAVPYLSMVLSPETPLPMDVKMKGPKRKEENVFVLRAAARSLGQIASRDGLAALVAVLRNEKTADDIRREAAIALGRIGDRSAVPALQGILTAQDPHLSQAAYDALRKISSFTSASKP